MRVCCVAAFGLSGCTSLDPDEPFVLQGQIMGSIAGAANYVPSPTPTQRLFSEAPARPSRARPSPKPSQQLFSNVPDPKELDRKPEGEAEPPRARPVRQTNLPLR